MTIFDSTLKIIKNKLQNSGTFFIATMMLLLISSIQGTHASSVVSFEQMGSQNEKILWGVNDDTSELFTLVLSDIGNSPVIQGTIKENGTRKLGDAESLAISPLTNDYYCIDNSTHELYKLDMDNIGNGVVPAILIGTTKNNGSTIRDIDSLSFNTQGILYGVSRYTRKLYIIDPTTAELTEIMSVGNTYIEGLAFTTDDQKAFVMSYV